MTTPIDRTPPPPADDISADPADRLRATMAACRVRFTWPGVRRSSTAGRKAAAGLDTQDPSLAADGKILDTGHAAFRAVTAVRTAITDWWRSRSLPFPEPGIRLIRYADLDTFDCRMVIGKEMLDAAVAELERHLAELGRTTAERPGSPRDPADDPPGLIGSFGVAWDYPNLEPPACLADVSPWLFDRERARVRARFERAVELAERDFLDEFARTVGHLRERLEGPDADGSPRVFRDSAVANLAGFFDRFGALNVHSSRELDDLVDRARRVMQGVTAPWLRGDPELRCAVAARLGEVRSSLEALRAGRPRRRILRGAAPGDG
jgi:hypothetical protein